MPGVIHILHNNGGRFEELNKEYAVKVLEMFGDNKSKAAEVLGISHFTETFNRPV